MHKIGLEIKNSRISLLLKQQGGMIHCGVRKCSCQPYAKRFRIIQLD
jgi:hypothetical protein